MEYIIYLHPKEGSEAFNQLSKFWEKGRALLPDNLAFRYPFHATLVSFFKTSEPKVVFEAAKNIFRHFSVSAGEIYTNGTFKMVPLQSFELDHYIATLVEKFDFIRSRVIGNLHITLTHEIKEGDIPVAEELTKIIDVSKWTDDWNVAMWCRNGENWTHMFLE